MDHLVDLDVLASRLRPVVSEWRSRSGIDVGPLTWRDELASWPQPILTDRSSIEVPESVGLRVRRGQVDELEVCVWTGGWADVGYVRDDQVVDRSPHFQDVDGALAVVVENVEDFLARDHAGVSREPGPRNWWIRLTKRSERRSG
ncbi:hypothetical protein HP550_06690 [Cellulomonas humilata]|uniref:Uncharacterized protein n=1 Tax=Cellulomonas humilata TaxID=144055 RepID=A0A7Y5ZZG5_9CELL|nr:hypothetical protein [Cellulomonas humilata]NUU16936.1 hypothetical protein [Cellulomonas humilata]